MAASTSPEKQHQFVCSVKVRKCCGAPQVIRAALADSGLAVSRWHSVEMHGTGTALGDPIETGAIGAVASRSPAGAHPHKAGTLGGGGFSQSLSDCRGSVSLPSLPDMDGRRCLHAGARLCLAAAKSRVGHAETAAGAVGLTRTLEALGAAALAPVQHLADVNALVCGTLDAVAKESAISTSIARQVTIDSSGVFFGRGPTERIESFRGLTWEA